MRMTKGNVWVLCAALAGCGGANANPQAETDTSSKVVRVSSNPCADHTTREACTGVCGWAESGGGGGACYQASGLATDSKADTTVQPVLLLTTDITFMAFNTITYSPAFVFTSGPVRATQFAVQAAGPRCTNQVVAFNYTTFPGQTVLTPAVQTGINTFTATAPNGVFAVEFAILNGSFFPFGGCQVSVWALDMQSTTTPPGPETLAGFANYTGGLANVTMAVTAQVVKSFRVAVPSFCPMDVVQAGFNSSFGPMTATLADPANHVYSINNGQGFFINEIDLTLNGPTGQSCQVPVFIRN
jgi:hypothetical protein